MRAGVGVFAIVAGLALAASASATESTIYPGVGIGKVKLGMTGRAGRAALGQRLTVVDRLRRRRALRRARLELRQLDGRLRAKRAHPPRSSRCRRRCSRQKHAAPASGTGSLWRRVVRAYPGGRCALATRSGAAGLRGGTIRLASRVSRCRTRAVPRHLHASAERTTGRNIACSRRHIRKPFTPLGEFARDSAFRCRLGWENTGCA